MKERVKKSLLCIFAMPFILAIIAFLVILVLLSPIIALVFPNSVSIKDTNIRIGDL
jgi:hypothetical protein